MKEPITQKDCDKTLEYYMLIVAANTKRFRLERSLTQEDLAHRSGLTQRNISMIEKYDGLNPGLLTIIRLAKSLQCSFNDMFRGSQQVGPEERKYTFSELMQEVTISKNNFIEYVVDKIDYCLNTNLLETKAALKKFQVELRNLIVPVGRFS